MSEFAPVLTLKEFDALDDAEVVAGYMSASEGDPEPGSNHTRDYWHGWQCGMADRFGRPMNDEAGHRRLVHLATRRPGGILGLRTS